jgi:hypothetical protein
MVNSRTLVLSIGKKTNAKIAMEIAKIAPLTSEK